MSLKTDPAEEQEESYATDELSLEDQLSFQDKYQTLGLIGSGGQGQVYKVQDRASGEVYAAKRMPVDNFEDIEKLKNETRALQNLKHPLIPQYHGFYVQTDTQWGNPEYILVTEYAEGDSLSKKLGKGTRFSEEELRNVKTQVLDALHAAHAKGIVHRDIKPSNIIIDDAQNIKVTDFGIAKFLGEKTRTRTIGAGSIEYMAPEQKKGEAIVPETDYYALGATLVALAYGVELGVNSNPKDMLKELQHLNRPFRNSIELLLSDDPQQRKEGILEKEVKKKRKAKVEVVQEEVNPEESFGRGLTYLLVSLVIGTGIYLYSREADNTLPFSQTWNTWSARWDAEEKLVQTIDQNCDGFVSAEEFQTAYKTATQQEFPGVSNQKDTLVEFDVEEDGNFLTIGMKYHPEGSSFKDAVIINLGKQSAEQLIKANEGFGYCKVPQK